MRTVIISLALLVGAIGCSKNKVQVKAPTPPEPESSVAATPPAPNTEAAAPAAADACGSIRVHFPFDSSVVIAEERPLLEKAASCLKDNAGLKILIEGNADERGTVEYNIALGQRRADAVRQYLEELGVSAKQLSTVSYGKEKPLCTEQTEDCWMKNRRAQLNPSSRG
jgi:peptidoglycan-associated lipoprotein